MRLDANKIDAPENLLLFGDNRPNF